VSEIDEDETPLSEFPIKPFNFIDVLQSIDWFYDDVYFVFQQGLMTGTTDTTFEPGVSLTRGMLVTILGRHFNIDVSKYAGSVFTDVDGKQYYAPYVAWAAERGLVKGIGEGKFDPDRPITRQEAALLLLRYAEFIGYTFDEDASVTFEDADEIDKWAIDAVGRTVKRGLINGKPGNIFDPVSDMTRGETAALLHRFLLQLDELQGTDNTEE
jgi:hypothetical protein